MLFQFVQRIENIIKRLKSIHRVGDFGFFFDFFFCSHKSHTAATDNKRAAKQLNLCRWRARPVEIGKVCAINLCEFLFEGSAQN